MQNLDSLAWLKLMKSYKLWVIDCNKFSYTAGTNVVINQRNCSRKLYKLHVIWSYYFTENYKMMEEKLVTLQFANITELINHCAMVPW